MLVPMKWLAECVEIPCPLGELEERLTDSGTEVEGRSRLCGQARDIRVARVAALDPHPTKPGLRVAALDLGDGRAVVVTAATNLREGDRVPYGAPGSVLADGTVLGVRDFDGVESRGMMLSAGELGLPDVADEFGILRLDEEPLPGSDALEAYGFDDQVLDLAITPNRGDLLSILGVAREAYALVPGSELLPRSLTPPAGPEDWPFPFEGIDLEDPGCSSYALGCAWDFEIRPAPLRERVRIAAAGMRPIDGIVDATNMVMLFWGQPLHAFDADRLPRPRIGVRSAREGERLTTLDGKERSLVPTDLVIFSGDRTAGLAGVMGGEETEVTAATRRIVLESAVFDPGRIGFTSRRMGLVSQASARYARGIDAMRSLPAAYSALSLMASWCGAKISPRVLFRGSRQPSPREASLRRSALQRVIRYDDLSGASAILERLGFEGGGGTEDARSFRIPSWRNDVEMEADLVEEVGRIRGYNDVPSRIPPFLRQPGELTEPVRATEDLRRAALARGYTEAVAYSFIAPSDLEGLRLPEGDPRRRTVRIANPISGEQSVMRTFLLPGLLKAVRGNLRRGRRSAQRIFELGRAFLPEGEEIREEEHLAGIVAEGRTDKALWGEREREDFFSVKADLEALLGSRSRDALFVPSEEPFGAVGQTAAVVAEGRTVGWIARIKPSVAREMDLPGSAWAFEVEAEFLFEPRLRSYGMNRRFPASYRDVAFLAPLSVSAREAEERIREYGGPLLESAELFDLFTGSALPEGTKSLAFSLAYRHPDRTLEDEEVARAVSDLRSGLGESGFILR